MAFADEYGFMTAKHILFRNTDDEGNELSEEEMSSKLEQANELVSELRAPCRRPSARPCSTR